LSTEFFKIKTRRREKSLKTLVNFVWEIVEDQQGLLWLAADQALVSLNPVTEEFTAYPGAAEERRLAPLVKW
jgi:hypothetical protein